MANRRQRGFEAALRERHITADPALMEVGFFRRDGGHAAMHRVLTRDLTAVFAANDLMALGALAALHEAGRRVPDDVALVSIDNIIEAAESDPGLSTVAIPQNYEHGRVAAQLLLDRLQGSGDTSGPPRRVELDTRLIVRGSTVKGVTGYL